MDKRSLLAFVLIGIIVTGWLVWVSTTEEPVEDFPGADSTESVSNIDKKKKKTEGSDSISAGDIAGTSSVSDTTLQTQSPGDLMKIEKYGELFSPFASDGKGDYYVIENDLVKAYISTKGFVIKKWFLKDYKTWNGYQSQLIDEEKGELFLKFTTIEGKRIDSRDLIFNLENDLKGKTYIKSGDSLSISARLQLEDGKFIRKTFTFYGDKYLIGNDITLNNMDAFIPARGYDIVWSDGLKYQEKNSVDESNSAEAMVSMNGEIETLNADEDTAIEGDYTGIIDYIGVKTKYFAAAIIPQPYRSFDGTADLLGTRERAKNEGMIENYQMSIRVPYQGGVQRDRYNVYIGPLDYDIVSDYELKEMVDFGWRIIIRPIGEYFMLPIFTFIHQYIPNYGISIIIFSILMKMLLYPLSIQQMKSAQKMKLLGPELQKVRDKYKDDPQKQQKETMALYSSYGINPMGGCLPLLLQMPILYALWSVLRTSIELRQADFALWITDLSTPDYIVNLGFSFLGIQYISGLALAMGVTMFIQQKLTITDPRQKALVYMMPIMFTIMFSYFPSGLNLYYFMFNLLGILQQLWINNYSKNKLTLDDLKKAPKKEGWLQKKMREAQEMAEAQGKTIPGQPKSTKPQNNTGKTKYNRKKKK